MAVDAHHPQYDLRSPDWTTMRDTYAGQRRIKEQGTLYLPPTSGQIIDGALKGNPESIGRKAYEAYKMRAVFPEYTKNAANTMIGMMHRQPAKITLPSRMEGIRENATPNGESLQALLQRINAEQLVTGRIGLLVDVPSGEGVTQPYIATYAAERIINWDDGARGMPVRQNLNLVVLEETESERVDRFDWEEVQKYRVLFLGDLQMNEGVGQGVYRVGVERADSDSFSEDQAVTPVLGGEVLDEIPFVFINTLDLLPAPDLPPLLPLSNASLTIYRAEADYRLTLFMQGQDTLVVIGGSHTSDDELRVGANSRIDLPSGGDAKYIGVGSEGLPEMRQALENDRNAAAMLAMQLLDNRAKAKESGDALKTRVASQAATLTQIARIGASGLERALKIAARWMGEDPSQVSVVPNVDFAVDGLGGRELLDIMSAKVMGAPLSDRSIHDLQAKNGMTDRTYEDEIALLEEEGGMRGMPDRSEANTNPDLNGVTTGRGE